ncbi:type II secretion system F family protein [Candidatus Pacearchaeota archaeon]|nr:type II secretion system F family protein [Candidatus Pacearchaeota archaeon]
MEIKKSYWVGIIISMGILLSSILFIDTNFFFFIIGSAVLVGASPFVFATIKEAAISSEKEMMFLEFSRNLVESVKTGTPISRSIINIKDKSYGVLSKNVEKLANQISLGIPLNLALKVFSRDVNHKNISRALTLIGQAERAGGEIGEILDAVTGAVRMTDKLKKERKAAISTLVVQGYIIFFVFVIIILVMQFQILPMISGIGDIGSIGGIVGGMGAETGQEEISISFLYLLLIQGFFSGLTIGKLAEGNVKAGIKHSFALVLMSFMVSTLANIIFGGG